MSKARRSSRRYEQVDLLSANGRALIGSGTESGWQRLAVQLTLAPAVHSLSFVAALRLAGEQIDVGMLVAEYDDGLVAYDIVDERDDRDIDTEGMLLIALDQHEISVSAVDSSSIFAQPLSRNCELIWKHRGIEVDPDIVVRIEHALEGDSLSVRELGHAVKERNVVPMVASLICKRVLYTDPFVELDMDAWIARRSHRRVEDSPAARRSVRRTGPRRHHE